MEALTENAIKTEGRPEAERHHFDFPLFIVLMLICAFGLVMLFSASYYYASVKYGDGMYFLKRQLVFFGVGLAGLFVLSNVKYSLWRKIVLPAYIAVCALLALTLVPGIGVKINEARRWINIAGFQFQPSEFAKIMLIIALASLMCSKRVHMQSLIQGIIPCCLVLVPFAGLIILQPNYSMVLLLCFITYAMLYLGGSRLSHRFLLVIVGLFVGLLAIKLAGYRMTRIDSYLNPASDPSGAGYQAMQSRIALGSGGLFGQGLNYSRQKLLYLPERENDYILAIIGEELGFVGCFALIAAYVFVIWRGVTIALRCRDRFGRLLAGGITSMLAIQAILNIGVVTGAIPSTGQTLPFISYGGTSLMMYLGSMGILLNISRYTEVDTQNARRTEQ